MILVTGVSGFIGKHLLKGLISKYGAENILALTSKPITECAYLLHNNYNFDKNYFNDAGYANISAIIHAGAYTPKQVNEANQIEKCGSNISSLQLLLQTSFPNLQKIVFLSTLDVYNDDGVISELTTVNPVSLYGHSKLYGEKMVQAWAEQNNKILQVLRIGHVYGPGEESYQKLIPSNFLRLVRDASIEMWGDGSEVRSFIYVQDVVEAVINSMNLQQTAGIINVVGEEQITVRELIQKMISVSGVKAAIHTKPALRKGRDLKFDTTKLKQYLLVKQTPLEQGLREEWSYLLKR